MNDIDLMCNQTELEMLIAESNYLIKEAELSEYVVMESEEQHDHVVIKILKAIGRFFKAIFNTIINFLKKLKSSFKTIKTPSNKSFIKQPEYKSIWLSQDENHQLKFVKFPIVRPTPDTLTDYQKIMHQENAFLESFYENAGGFNYQSHRSIDLLQKLLESLYDEKTKGIKHRNVDKYLKTFEDQIDRMNRSNKIVVWRDDEKKRLMDALQNDWESYYTHIEDTKALDQSYQTITSVAEDLHTCLQKFQKYSNKASNIEGLNFIEKKIEKKTATLLLKFVQTMAEGINSVSKFTNETLVVAIKEVTNYRAWKDYYDKHQTNKEKGA